jgi:hypothetical protein
MCQLENRLALYICQFNERLVQQDWLLLIKHYQFLLMILVHASQFNFYFVAKCCELSAEFLLSNNILYQMKLLF